MRKSLKSNKNTCEDAIIEIEEIIASKCQEEKRKQVIEICNQLEGRHGIFDQRGLWKTKQQLFPRIKPSLPIAKKNLKGQLITHPDELKALYLETFRFRLRHRPVKPGFES